MDAIGVAHASIQARVFRIAWDRKPSWVPKGIWMALGRRRVPFTGRWENLGVISSSEDGTVETGVVNTGASSARLTS